MVDVLEGVVVVVDGMRRLEDVVDGGARSLGEVVDAVVLVFVAIVGVLECWSLAIFKSWDI